jgi:hypothetical protein
MQRMNTKRILQMHCKAQMSSNIKLELSEIRELASNAGFIVKHCPSFNSTTFEATNGTWNCRIDKELLTLVRLIEERLLTK